MHVHLPSKQDREGRPGLYHPKRDRVFSQKVPEKRDKGVRADASQVYPLLCKQWENGPLKDLLFSCAGLIVRCGAALGSLVVGGGASGRQRRKSTPLAVLGQLGAKAVVRDECMATQCLASTRGPGQAA
jgi:hypothetical protein